MASRTISSDRDEFAIRLERKGWMRSDSNFATKALSVGSCQSVVDAGALGSHAESGQRVSLRGQV